MKNNLGLSILGKIHADLIQERGNFLVISGALSLTSGYSDDRQVGKSKKA